MKNKLHKNAIKSWVIARIIVSVLFLCVCLLALYIAKFKFPISWIINNERFIIMAILVVEIICIINAIIYPMLEYKIWRYELTSDKIEFTEGIFIKKTTIIPIIKIEHIEIDRGPINSKLGLANIEIFTAGGSHIIPNIEVKFANKIGEYLNIRLC